MTAQEAKHTPERRLGGVSDLHIEEQEKLGELFFEEAATVFGETGLTPRQLADEVEKQKHAVDHFSSEMFRQDKEIAKLTFQRDELLGANKEAADFLLATFGNVSNPDDAAGWSTHDAFSVFIRLHTAIAKAEGGAA